MIIRRATAADAPAIAGVLAAAFAEYEPLYTPEGLAATTPPAERIAARLDEGPTWVAVQEEAIAGTVGVVRRGEALYVRSMAVLPAARGQRVGEALLREVEAFARTAGATSLLLSTTPFLARAIRLYEQWGFQYSDAGPHDLYGTPLLTMVKLLPLIPDPPAPR
jgi:GNAT superfamily N-acetyltransferase